LELVIESFDISTRVQWTDHIEQRLAPVCGSSLEFIKENVQEGKFWLLAYPDDSYAVLYMDADTKTLTGMAGVGRRYKERIAIWVDWCIQHGITFRIHSHRRGIGRMLESFGFELEFITMKLTPPKENKNG